MPLRPSEPQRHIVTRSPTLPITTAPDSSLPPDPAQQLRARLSLRRHARSFAFGPFVLRPERQLLLKGGMPVRIGGRALDILTTLVERPGQLVDRATLVSRAWPTTFVDESNLKVNVSGLRRVLEERADAPRYIATVAGRGYRFIATVRTLKADKQSHDCALELHGRLHGLIETIDRIRRDLAEERLVSASGDEMLVEAVCRRASALQDELHPSVR